jgi:hypothetical protein
VEAKAQRNKTSIEELRAGHVIRTSENRIIKKIFNTKPDGKRKVGRPKLRN